MNHLPNLSFLQSRPARIALARQRFFEKGHTPTGVVVMPSSNPGRAACASWASRLSGPHSSPSRPAARSWHCRRMPWASPRPVRSHAPESRCVCSVVSISSTASRACTVPQRPSTTCAGSWQAFSTSPASTFHLRFHAAAVAGLDAGAIKNRLLVAQSVEHLVIGLQVAPALASRFIGKGFERRHRLCPVIEACSIHALPNAGSRIQPAGRAAWLPTHWQTVSGPAGLPLGPSGRSS